MEVTAVFVDRETELQFLNKTLQLPATLTVAQQRKSRQGRYHLSDPYLRFYFRFLAPHLDDLVLYP